MLTPGQCRAARGFLRWSLKELSHRAKVSIVTISRFEAEQASPIPATRQVLQRAFEDAGIVFADSDVGEVVELRRKG